MEKESKKKISVPFKVFSANNDLESFSKIAGFGIEHLKEWKKEYDKENIRRFKIECQDKLNLVEDAIAVGNIVACLLAIEKTWGFKKANCRFLDNLLETTKYVEEIGIEKAYEQVKNDMGIEIDFIPADIRKEFWFEEEL